MTLVNLLGLRVKKLEFITFYNILRALWGKIIENVRFLKFYPTDFMRIFSKMLTDANIFTRVLAVGIFMPLFLLPFFKQLQANASIFACDGFDTKIASCRTPPPRLRLATSPISKCGVNHQFDH